MELLSLLAIRKVVSTKYSTALIRATLKHQSKTTTPKKEGQIRRYRHSLQTEVS